MELGAKRFQKSTFHVSGRVTHCHCEERSDVAISAVPMTTPDPMRKGRDCHGRPDESGLPPKKHIDF